MDDNKDYIAINYPVVFVILLQIIFIIFGVITIKNLLSTKPNIPKVSIDNYSEIAETTILGQTSKEINKTLFSSAENKSLVESVLYNITLLNTNGSNITKKDAIIRDGSVHNVYISDLNIYLLNMIIDVQEIGQSYRIVYRWTDNYPNRNVPVNGPAMAFCLHESELIYDNFNCKDEYNNRGINTVFRDLTRDYPFKTFSIKTSDTDTEGQLVNTIQLFPGEEITEETAKQELSDYLSELGFNLDDFKYDFTKLTIQPLPDGQKPTR